MSKQTENGTVLTAEQLALLEAIQNRLIPAQDGMPGAGDAGCAKMLDRFLSVRPALRRAVIRCLERRRGGSRRDFPGVRRGQCRVHARGVLSSFRC